jgi:enoyl-[acyl-carrier-protein] reductase (NADH)
MRQVEWLIGETRLLMNDFEIPGNARGAALLARQAVEDAVETYLETRYKKRIHPRPDFWSMLVVLDAETDRMPELNHAAKRVAWTWSALSNACHAHAYPLDPTLDELERWISSIETFVAIAKQ